MPLPTSYEDFALHQRALEGLQQRNMQRRSQAAIQGQPFSLWAEERPDPNFGMWGDVLQGMNEAAEGQGTIRAKLRTPRPMDTNPAIQGLLKVR